MILASHWRSLVLFFWVGWCPIAALGENRFVCHNENLISVTCRFTHTESNQVSCDSPSHGNSNDQFTSFKLSGAWSTLTVAMHPADTHCTFVNGLKTVWNRFEHIYSWGGQCARIMMSFNFYCVSFCLNLKPLYENSSCGYLMFVGITRIRDAYLRHVCTHVFPSFHRGCNRMTIVLSATELLVSPSQHFQRPHCSCK